MAPEQLVRLTEVSLPAWIPSLPDFLLAYPPLHRLIPAAFPNEQLVCRLTPSQRLLPGEFKQLLQLKDSLVITRYFVLSSSMEKDVIFNLKVIYLSSNLIKYCEMHGFWPLCLFYITEIFYIILYVYCICMCVYWYVDLNLKSWTVYWINVLNSN